MSVNKFYEDLLNDFKEQKKVLIEQIELFDPLALSLRKPAAQRLMSKGGLIIAEIFCYLLCLAFVAFVFTMNLIFPFTGLSGPGSFRPVHNPAASQEAEYLSIAVHAMAAVTGILFFIIARMTRRIRLKNNVLHLAGTNMKILVGQHLKRKAAIESIEQRHNLELPSYAGFSSINEIPNPAFDAEENNL